MMLAMWTALACTATQPEPVAAPEPFRFEMVSRGTRTLSVTDASTREPVQGAIVGLQRTDTGQLLARAVVTRSGTATVRLSHAMGAPIELVGLHPDYAVTRVEQPQIEGWLAGTRELSLVLEPR